MKVFSHKFPFVGSVKQGLYSDLTMTTGEVEGVEGKVVCAHRVDGFCVGEA